MRKLSVLGPIVLPLFVVACGKGPAQAALATADEAIAKVRPEGERYVPGEFKALSDEAAAAHAKFEAGDYKGALEAATSLPPKVQAVAMAANAKRDELVAEWNTLKASLPGMVKALTDRVAQLVAMRRLPRGIDATTLESAKTEAAALAQLWTSASGAFDGGDVPGAVAKAGDVRTRAEELGRAIGVGR